MKVKAVISYDGNSFFGMQKQPNKITISGEIEKALSFLNINSTINYAGRTDARVHALNQVIDFNIPNYWSNLDKLKYNLNKILDDKIFIKNISFVDDNFHSRFLAKKRSYRYIVSTKYNPFLSNYVCFKSLDVKLLKEAIKEFIGIYDFEYFSKKSDNKTTIREIFDAKVFEYKGFIIFIFVANGFLRSQIRMMVDFLFKISDRKLSINELKQQLRKEKIYSNTLALPNGLYFNRAYY